MLLVAADLDDLRRDVVKPLDTSVGDAHGVHAVRVGFRPVGLQLLPELEVLPGQVLVDAAEVEVVRNGLRASPDGAHDAMRGAGKPEALKFGVPREHLQRSNLHDNEDCCAEESGKELPFFLHTSSASGRSSCPCS